jgi:HEAT repeat protein
MNDSPSLADCSPAARPSIIDTMGRVSAVIFLVAALVSPLEAQSAGQRFLNKTSSAWRQELKSPHASNRRSAAFALGKLGAEGTAFIEDLVRVLGDKDESVREAAAAALGEIGAIAAAEAALPLTRLLQSDPSATVQRSAAAALGKMGTRAAGEGDTITVLRKALGHQDPRVRQNAAWALGQIGPSGVETAVPDLLKLLKDDDAMVRRDTAQALGNGGAVARDAVHDLTSAVHDSDLLVRRYATVALGKLGSAAEPAVPVLVGVLDDKSANAELQREALLAICQIGGTNAPEILPALRKALRDEDPLLREVAAGALLNLGEAAMPALPDLIPLLKEPEFRIRRNATLVLDRLLPKSEGAVARRAVPGLLHILENEQSADLRLYVCWCFLQIPVDLKEREFRQAKEILIKAALHDESFNVRCEAARAAVFNFGPEARAVTPTLIENLKQKTRIIDSTSAKTDGVGGEGAGGGTSVETKGTRDGRVLPATALGVLGKAAGPAAKKALEEAAQDPDSPDLREAAKKALKNF